MHQRRAVQQLDRGGGGIGEGGVVVPAGMRDGEAEPRPDPRAAREDGVAHRLGQARRGAPHIGPVHRGREGPLDARYRVHGPPSVLSS